MVLAAGFGMAAAALVLASVLGVLTGVGRVVAAQYLESVYRPALFVGSLLLVALILVRPVSVGDVVLVQVGSGIAIAGYGILALYRDKYLCLRLASNGIVETKKWLNSAVVLGTGGLVLVLQQRLGVFLLGLVSSPDQVGLFQLALRTSEVLTLTHAAIGLVIAPKISQLYAKNNASELERMVFQGALLSFVIGLVMYTAILLHAEYIITLIYGDSYVGAADLLRVLGFGAVVSMSAGFPAVVLNMIGFEGDALRGIAIGATVNLILGGFLVYLFGPIGVAISGAAGVVVVNVVLVGLVRKRAGIRVAIWEFSG
jgi:O-antigen/teichoic acid export membrane protein